MRHQHTWAAARGSPAAASPWRRRSRARATTDASKPARMAALPALHARHGGFDGHVRRASSPSAPTPSRIRTFLTRTVRRAAAPSPPGCRTRPRRARGRCRRAGPASSASQSRKAAFCRPCVDHGHVGAVGGEDGAQALRERVGRCAQRLVLLRRGRAERARGPRHAQRRRGRDAPRAGWSSGGLPHSEVTLRLLPACLEQDQVAPVDNLVEVLLPERPPQISLVLRPAMRRTSSAP